jgi:hypothetical protein
MRKPSQASISKDIEDRRHEHDNPRGVDTRPPVPTAADAYREASSHYPKDRTTMRNLERIKSGKRYPSSKRKQGRAGGRS